MLETLFNSKPKVKILNILVTNQDKEMTVGELTKKIHSTKPSTSAALRQLVKAGIVVKGLKTVEGHKKKKNEVSYTLNQSYILIEEIQALFIKSQLLLESDLIEKIKKIEGTLLIVLAGVFTGKNIPSETDILIVGKVNRKKVERLIKTFEKKIDREINYTIMSRAEYTYRKAITDRFLYGILEGIGLVIVDKIKE